MRISGGEARGIRLRVPKGARPASERVRQAVFSSLAAHVPGARVLDLYCGSGAYGLEALSRSAASAVLVDRSAAAVSAARVNARAARLASRVTVRHVDVDRYDPAPDAPFDLVFADPPYGAEGLPGILHRVRPATAPDARCVIETRWGPDPPPEVSGYVLEADRRYGDTRVLVYRREDR